MTPCLRPLAFTLAFVLAGELALASPVAPAASQQRLSSSGQAAVHQNGQPFQAPAERQRCGYDDKHVAGGPLSSDDASDCGSSTNPDPVYGPTFVYNIPVVFHVIQNTSGDGALSPETIQDQIDVLNEDFRALLGSPGAPGVDTMIQFQLATVDPAGNPTTGITYSTNDAWHDDEYTTPGYWEVLQWDPLRYLNVYTLNTVGYYGYYWGSPGSIEDGVYLWWPYVGKNSSSTSASDNYGRTGTHEVGHYLGLHHTFQGGCAGGDCYSSGDTICDTNPQSSATWGCPSSEQSCGSEVPVRNYMNYTDDDCMWEFTAEQTLRMRCRIQWYRSTLATISSHEDCDADGLPDEYELDCDGDGTPDDCEAVVAQDPRLGSPANPNVLLPGVTSAPVVGQTWDPVIDHTAFVPGAAVDILCVSTAAANVPLPPLGTLLCDLSAPTLLFTAAPGVPFAVFIPDMCQAIGATFSTQGYSTDGGTVAQLTNALDITIGTR